MIEDIVGHRREKPIRIETKVQRDVEIEKLLKIFVMFKLLINHQQTKERTNSVSTLITNVGFTFGLQVTKCFQNPVKVLYEDKILTSIRNKENNQKGYICNVL